METVLLPVPSLVTRHHDHLAEWPRAARLGPVLDDRLESLGVVGGLGIFGSMGVIRRRGVIGAACLALPKAIHDLHDRWQVACVAYTALLCDTQATDLGAETVGERKQRRLPDLAEAMLTFQKGHRIEGGDTHIEQEKVVVHHATGLAQPPNIARQGHRVPALLQKLDQPAGQILDVPE